MRKRLVLFGGTVVIMGLAACSGGGGSSSQIPSIMSPSDMSNQAAAAKNNEGVDHLVQGHFSVATPLFQEAVSASPNFAEAHFNLGVSLDGEGKHQEATEAFKKAKELGATNPKIAEAEILKKHLGI